MSTDVRVCITIRREFRQTGPGHPCPNQARTYGGAYLQFTGERFALINRRAAAIAAIRTSAMGDNYRHRSPISPSSRANLARTQMRRMLGEWLHLRRDPLTGPAHELIRDTIT